MTTRFSIPLALLVGATIIPGRTHAQEDRRPTIDVRSVEVLMGRSNGPSKLLLIGTNGRKHVLPDGTFRSEAGATIIVLDGRIASVAAARGVRVEIESVRVERGGTISLIGTNGVDGPALAPVPDGRYATRDGAMIVIQHGAITRASIK